MAGLKALFALSFTASVGLMLLILGCALPQYNNWWPFFVIAFYILSPVPSFIARRISNDPGSCDPCRELAYFITAVIVVSAYALPVILARAPSENAMQWGACCLVLAGNTITFLTIFGFFFMIDSDSVEYSMW